MHRCPAHCTGKKFAASYRACTVKRRAQLDLFVITRAEQRTCFRAAVPVLSHQGWKLQYAALEYEGLCSGWSRGQAYVGAFMKDSGSSSSSSGRGSDKEKDPAGLSSLIASEDDAEDEVEGENDERPALDANPEIRNLHSIGTFCQARCAISTDCISFFHTCGVCSLKHGWS